MSTIQEVTWANHVTWDKCSRCGGDLPMLNGNNGHPDLPTAKDDCPGRQTPQGNCGVYSDATLAEWLDEPSTWVDPDGLAAWEMGR
jgi:hypothetical protein